MRRITILFFSYYLSTLLNAQIGINTKNPLGILHIDPSNNTSGTVSPSNDSDDVIVTNNGKVGIGTSAPNTLLEIKTSGTPTNPVSGFQLQDGNESEGNVMTSINNSGLATWRNLTPAIAVEATRNTGVNIGFNDPNYYRTNTQINLPPGRWALNIISLISGISTIQVPVWISSSFADDSTIANNGGSLSSLKTSDIEGQGVIAGLCWSQHNSFMTIIGSIIINNKSMTSKTYHYISGATSSFSISLAGHFQNVGGEWGETNIIAYRIPSDI